MMHTTEEKSRMSNVPTWRSVLRSLLKDRPGELERLAAALEVNEVSLQRWARNTTSPRPHHLALLFRLLPADDQAHLLPLIREEFPDFLTADTLPDEDDALDGSSHIEGSFYDAVFAVQEQATDRFWQICSLVLEQALLHLGTFRPRLSGSQVGLQVSVVTCMPPRPEDGLIHSLRVALAMGTAPWQTDLHPQYVLLGSESLAGYAVMSQYEAVVAALSQEVPYPVHHIPGEASVAAFPIKCGDALAGAFVVSCTEAKYLEHPSRLALIKAYARLIRLAFVEQKDFSPASRVRLDPMPLWDVQLLRSAHFRQDVAHKSRELAQRGDIRDIRAVEQLVLQAYEEEFLTSHTAQTAPEIRLV